MIALFNPNTFSLTNVPELEGSRSRLLEKPVATVCLSVPRVVVHALVFDAFIISVYVLYTHKLLVTLSTCYNNGAAFVCISGLVIVVAIATICIVYYILL